MALQLVVDTLESVPEALHSLYTEADGKFRLQVDGIEDTKGLKSALEKERQTAKDAEKARKDFEKQFEGIDPKKVKDMMSRFDNDEELKLISEGKISEVVEKRMERQRADLERQLGEKDGAIDAANKRADAYIQSVLDNEIRSVATGLHKFAVDDALLLGRQIFKLDENGRAVQFGSDGKPVMGKDGKTPFGPGEWIDGMKSTKPHWFPSTASGGGASGHMAVSGGADMSKMSPTERLTAARARQGK
ncbi:MAG: hypothetical protein WA191_06855 [Telluria sp.]